MSRRLRFNPDLIKTDEKKVSRMFHCRLLLCLFLFAFLPGWGNAKVYDCFLFYNEMEILDIRLHELYDHVDKFVLVECTETFRGNLKPLHFMENSERYAAFADKIIHIVVDERVDTTDPWTREEFQRNQIMRGLTECTPDDIIMLSDVDEIVRAANLPLVFALLKTFKTIGCRQTMYRFFLNAQDNIVAWTGSIITTFDSFAKYSPEFIRKNRWNYVQCLNMGWHFTSMGGLDAVALKLASFSHAEEDIPERKTEAYTLNYMRKHCQIVPVNEFFPKYIQENLDYFLEKGYIFEGNL